MQYPLVLSFFSTSICHGSKNFRNTFSGTTNTCRVIEKCNREVPLEKENKTTGKLSKVLSWTNGWMLGALLSWMTFSWTHKFERNPEPFKELPGRLTGEIRKKTGTVPRNDLNPAVFATLNRSPHTITPYLDAVLYYFGLNSVFSSRLILHQVLFNVKQNGTLQEFTPMLSSKPEKRCVWVPELNQKYPEEFNWSHRKKDKGRTDEMFNKSNRTSNSRNKKANALRAWKQ